MIWLLFALSTLARGTGGGGKPWVVRPTTPHGCSSRWLGPGPDSAELAADYLNASNTTVPRVLHRSHRFAARDLAVPVPPSTPEKAQRAAVNLDSCAAKNPDFITLYYDDAAVLAAVEARLLPALSTEAPAVHGKMAAAWARLTQDLALRQPFVLKSDLFRLAIVWLDGGWWLDADARCLDPISETLAAPTVQGELAASWRRACAARAGGCEPALKPATAGCVWAWEGEAPQADELGTSSPLNWAFGCQARHLFLLRALDTIAGRIVAWRPDPRSEFAVRIRLPNSGPYVHVNVLRLTGPTALEHVLAEYAGARSARALRLEVSLESPTDPSTWDRGLFVPAPSAGLDSGRTAGTVFVLPYCFFRSRGCAHLKARFGDRVIFHHEFDTDWRRSFWHNYLPSPASRDGSCDADGAGCSVGSPPSPPPPPPLLLMPFGQERDSFGAVVSTPIRDILSDPEVFQPRLLEAFERHSLLFWRSQAALSPADELALMQLLPYDASAPPDKLYGPLGVKGVDRERYLRWRLPGTPEVLLQGEGPVPDGYHGVKGGSLSSGKPVLEWHTDGLYEQDTPSVATSMYSVSVKPVGGDTLFMPGEVIYRSLPPALKELADDVEVHYSRLPRQLHKSGYRVLLPVETAGKGNGALYAGADKIGFAPGSSHPLVWVGLSGRRSVQVSPMWMASLTNHSTGAVWEDQDAQLFLERVLAHGAPFEYRHEWKVDDFVVWDNRALLHSATPNNLYSSGGLRLLHRIRLCGPSRPQGTWDAPAST